MRVRAAVLAAVLTLTLTSLPTTAAAAAAPAPGWARHDLEVDAKEIGGADRFVLYGNVPTYPRRRVVVTRSVGDGPYRRLKKIATTRTGSFRTRIYQVPGRVTCFKVVVPATDRYRRTTSRGAPCHHLVIGAPHRPGFEASTSGHSPATR